MSGLGSCPVCFLDLRPEIPLNVHLDTHPKEMIVKALMSALGTSGSPMATAVASGTAHNMTPMVQRDFIQPHEFAQSGYIFQQSTTLPVATESKHYVEANYVQDCEGNIVLCTPEDVLAQEEYSEEASLDPDIEYIKTEFTEFPPAKKVPEEVAKPLESFPSQQSPSMKTPAKILSVAVLGPKDNITWNTADQESRLSPNSVLPNHPRKVGPVEIQVSVPANAPRSPAKVRPVATSVIRTTAESPKIDKLPRDDTISASPATAIEPEVNLSLEKDLSQGRLSPPPSTSQRWGRNVCKAPKVLKVTFKKPIYVESNAEEPQPSTSKQAAVFNYLPRTVSPTSISEAVEDVVEDNMKDLEEENEKKVLSASVVAAESTAGMLQLKAEACEEVFISQHSLIKLEGEDSSDDDMPLKLYVKREIEPSSLVEDLCLSESSVGSLLNERDQRVNVNIRAEEVMPAKGEISEQEQESNADSELLWPSSNVETFETSRILPSYETSVARESWNFGQANSCDNLTFNGIPKLSNLMMGLVEGTSIKVGSYQIYEAVAGPSDAGTLLESPCSSSSSPGPSFAEPTSSLMTGGTASTASKSSADRKLRPYSCPGCPESFRLYRQRKDHIIAHHEELLSKKQRYNYMRQVGKFEGLALDNATDTAGGGGGAHYGPESFTRRIEQLSVIKLHRFLIEFNLKALKETAFGRREEFRDLLVEFSQRRMYFCTDCKLQFTTMREYRKHMVVHPVKCYTCEKNAELEASEEASEQEAVQPGSSSSGTRVKMEAVVVVKEEPVEAVGPPQEDTTFWNWRSFVEHQKMHLGLKESKTCKKCNVSFSSRRKLNLHDSSVHRRKAYHCTFCSRTFMHFFRLKEHKRRHHFNFNKVTVTSGVRAGGGVRQKDYLCPCGEVFHSAAKFAWHKETHEKNPKGCLFCRERFVHKNSLSRHIRLAHPEKYSDYKKDTLPCPVCNQQFIRTSLKTHMASHMKRAEFQCSICNKVLSTKWNLKIHRWTHNSRSQMPFKCATCPKAFMRANDLQTHMNTHKAIRPFTCDYCGCQFSRKYNWVRHTREHETAKKFSCGQCGKAFHRAYYLKEHQRSHTNERPFECTICGKTSTTKTNHNKHLKIHHARDVTATEG